MKHFHARCYKMKQSMPFLLDFIDCKWHISVQEVTKWDNQCLHFWILQIVCETFLCKTIQAMLLILAPFAFCFTLLIAGVFALLLILALFAFCSTLLIAEVFAMLLFCLAWLCSFTYQRFDRHRRQSKDTIFPLRQMPQQTAPTKHVPSKPESLSLGLVRQEQANQKCTIIYMQKNKGMHHFILQIQGHLINPDTYCLSRVIFIGTIARNILGYWIINKFSGIWLMHSSVLLRNMNWTQYIFTHLRLLNDENMTVLLQE